MSGSVRSGMLVLAHVAGLVFLLAATPSIAEVVVDTSFGPRTALPGPDFEISASLGHSAGSNLFHSFESFNLSSSESATYTAPASATYSNVISRVTGDNASSIDGLLRSTIPGADFYFINPKGVMFGSNARIDVPGAFHVGSSDYMRLGDNGVYYADLGQDSVLTAAPPSAFGFLTTSPSAINVAGQLGVATGQTFSMVGGDLNITGGQVTAPAGRINAVSIASAGEVELPDNPEGDVQLSGFAARGNITVNQGALLSTSGDGGGRIQIRAGQLELVGAKMDADNWGNTEPAGGIDIEVDAAMIVDGFAQVEADVTAGGAGPNIVIRAGTLEMAQSSQIRTTAFADSTGAGGDIDINVNDSMLVRDGANVLAATVSSGDGGNIVIRTSQLETRDNGYIVTNTQFGTGNAGDITIETTDATLSATNTPVDLTGVLAQTAGAGAGGDLHFTSAGTLRIEDGALISAAVFNTGPGGDLTVDSGDIDIRGIDNPNIFTGIFANVFWTGTGGDLSIQSDTLALDNRGSISASTFSTGNSGHLSIDTRELDIRNASLLATSNLFSNGGSSSDMTINADSIYIEGPASSAEPFTTDFTGVTTSAGYSGGDAGNLTITAQEMTLTSRGSITASSFGPGRGGQVMLLVDHLIIDDGSSVLASAFGSGDAGGVRIEADTVRVEGVSPEPFVDITGETTLAPSGIASQSGPQGGAGGSVFVQARDIVLLDGGVIATNTFGAGDAGDIDLTAERVRVSGINADLAALLEAAGASRDEARSAVQSGTSSAFLREQTTGSGGDITITATDLHLDDSGMISANTTGPGRGGNVGLTASNVTLTNGALVTAQSKLESLGSSVVGDGGNIDILASNNVTLNSSNVSASSDGEGLAGDIYIDGGRVLESFDNSISTEAKVSDGGNIKLVASDRIRLVNSEVTTSVGSGDGAGGNINIDPEFVILQNSDILAQAFGGPGGNIYIVAGQLIATPNSTIDASSQLGVDGTVAIDAPETDIASQLEVLPESYLDATQMLRSHCGASGQTSSLVEAGPGGLPVEPDGYLPGFAGNALMYDRGDKRDGQTIFAPPANGRDLEGSKLVVSLAQSGCVR